MRVAGREAGCRPRGASGVHGGAPNAPVLRCCRVRTDQVVKHGPGPRRKRKAKQRQQAAEQQAAEQQATEQQQREQGQGGALASTQAQYAEDAEALNPVSCAVCGEDVALRGVADGVYHFFNVVASVS